MSVFNRGELHWELDQNVHWFTRTFNAWYNFQNAAEASTIEQVLDAMDRSATGEHHAEVRVFTQTLRDDPELAAHFHREFARQGRGILNEIDALIEADGTITADQIREFITGEAIEGGDADLETAVGSNAAETPEALFEHLTTDNGWWFNPFRTAYHTENSLPELRVFHDDAEFQQLLFDAADTPGFWEFMQSQAEIDGGIATSELLNTEEGREAIKDALRTIGSDDFDGNYAAALGAVREEYITQNFDTILDSIAEAHPDAAGLINSIREDAEVSAALQNAIASDPTMLPGLEEMLSGSGAGAMSAADLQAILDNPAQREMMINVLNAVAEDNGALDVNFSHVRRLIEANRNNDLAAAQAVLGEIGVDAEGLAGFNVFEFLFEFLENPGMAMTNLANDLVAAGQLQPEHANMLISFGTNVGGALINGSTIGAVYDVVQDHGGIGAIAASTGDWLDSDGSAIAARNGGLSFETSADPAATVTPVEDFAAHFDRALQGVDLNNTTAILNAAAAVNETFTDEAGLISTTANLRGQFEAAIAGATREEVVEEVAELMRNMERDGATVRTAMNNTF